MAELEQLQEGWQKVKVEHHLAEPKISMVVGPWRMMMGERELILLIARLTRAWNIVRLREGKEPVKRWEIAEL